MSKDPRSPFNWWMRTEPSIFAQDPQFRARKDGKTDSERATEITAARRSKGKDPVDLYALGAGTKKRRQQVLAYKQFGTNVNTGVSSKKPNKHEK